MNEWYNQCILLVISTTSNMHGTNIKLQVLVFKFILDFLWAGGGCSESSVALDGFRKLQHIEKHGIK
jgi:hypothetical protein